MGVFLDLRNGIGAATRQRVDLLAMLRSSSPQLSAPQLHALLKDDLAIRDRLEPTIAQCNSTFMMDYDRLIASYRLPRALAYANRRLCDEIAVLRQIGVAMGLWTVTEERRERVTVPVLLPGSALASGECRWMIFRIEPLTSLTAAPPVVPQRKVRSEPVTMPCRART